MHSRRDVGSRAQALTAWQRHVLHKQNLYFLLMQIIEIAWGFRGDFEGIAWGSRGDFLSFEGISFQMPTVLLRFWRDFRETSIPLYNIN